MENNKVCHMLVPKLKRNAFGKARRRQSWGIFLELRYDRTSRQLTGLVEGSARSSTLRTIDDKSVRRSLSEWEKVKWSQCI